MDVHGKTGFYLRLKRSTGIDTQRHKCWIGRIKLKTCQSFMMRRLHKQISLQWIVCNQLMSKPKFTQIRYRECKSPGTIQELLWAAIFFQNKKNQCSQIYNRVWKDIFLHVYTVLLSFPFQATLSGRAAQFVSLLEKKEGINYFWPASWSWLLTDSNEFVLQRPNLFPATPNLQRFHYKFYSMLS